MITFCKVDSKVKYDWFEWTLIGIVVLTSILYILISGKRYFNFDEFQVLYASAALVRGKALYADPIGVHFPLVNILYSILIDLGGFKAVVMLTGRYFIFCINGITLYYIYRIGCFLWNRKTGLMAVILTLVTVTFMQKGIEIRHDVFNTMFNVVGAYYALRYVNWKKYRHLILSGLFCGLAIASTQKAIVWSVGIILGVILQDLRSGSYKEIIKVVSSYIAMILLPLIICFAYLILAKNENIVSIYKHSFINTIIAFSPHTQTAYQFPHSRYGLLKILFYQNPLFYAIGIGGIVWLSVFWIRKGSEKIVLISWTTIGLLFYLAVKRPFYQSLLPTIPPLAIVASCFLSWIGEKVKDAQSYKKWVGGMFCAFFLFVWPFYFIAKVAYGPGTMDRQIDNVSFCLDVLKEDEKVMCLTQNQIFFDQILDTYKTECGKNIFFWDPKCFERKMIKEQCKIVIYDYRTSLLNERIQNKIKDNYVYTKIGEVLIPGFKIPPKKFIEKNIWIDGHYYSPNSSLIIEGKKFNGDFVRLEQKRYTIHNLSDKESVLIYVFNPDEIINKNNLLDTYIYNMF